VLVTRFLDSIEGAPPPVALTDSLAVMQTMEQIMQRWQPARTAATTSTPTTRGTTAARSPKAKAA
jgi:hypothetical protein